MTLMNRSSLTKFSLGFAWLLAACGQAASDGDTPGGATSTADGAPSNTSTPASPGPSASAQASAEVTQGGEVGNTSEAASAGDTSEAASAGETSARDDVTTGPSEATADDDSSIQTGNAVGSTAGDEASASDSPGMSSAADQTSAVASADTTSAPPAEPDPLFADPVCTSNKQSNAREGTTMRPGEACVACHTREDEGPRYSIAGTLYPTGHEPNNCVGSSDDSGSKIVITDANGEVYELTPNSVGNFYLNGAIASPYTAKVVSADGERLMLSPQTNGDCNTCHSAEGTSGAPGRIVVPF